MDITSGMRKKPHYVSLGGELMWAAGLWSTGLDQISTTMVTTDSVEPIKWLHHRLPRFLENDELERWLFASAEETQQMLHPVSQNWVERLSVRQVSTDVGNVRNDHAGLLD